MHTHPSPVTHHPIRLQQDVLDFGERHAASVGAWCSTDCVGQSYGCATNDDVECRTLVRPTRGEIFALSTRDHQEVHVHWGLLFGGASKHRGVRQQAAHACVGVFETAHGRRHSVSGREPSSEQATKSVRVPLLPGGGAGVSSLSIFGVSAAGDDDKDKDMHSRTVR